MDVAWPTYRPQALFPQEIPVCARMYNKILPRTARFQHLVGTEEETGVREDEVYLRDDKKLPANRPPSRGGRRSRRD